MGQFRDPAIVRQSLDLLLTGPFDIREVLGLLFGPLQNPATREIPYEFVKQHFDELVR